MSWTIRSKCSNQAELGLASLLLQRGEPGSTCLHGYCASKDFDVTDGSCLAPTGGADSSHADRLGLATITNKGTVLEETHEIPDGHDIHHLFANTFFLASYFQGGSFLISQCFRWKHATPLERRSFRWKVLVLFLVALSVSGVIPFLLIEALPPLRSTPKIRSLNRRGLTQRLVVLGMMIFTASYAFDLLALQYHLKEKGAESQHTVETNIDDIPVQV